jgi:hypothetical protein
MAVDDGRAREPCAENEYGDREPQTARWPEKRRVMER